MEVVKVSKSELTHPSKSNHVSEAVLREPSSLLFTFSKILDGVVLAYDVNSLDTCGKILPGSSPLLGLGVKLKVVLERKKRGQDVYHKRHVIRFLVKSFEEEILHVYGSLIPNHTGSIYWLDKNLEVVSHTDRTCQVKLEGTAQPYLIPLAPGASTVCEATQGPPESNTLWTKRMNSSHRLDNRIRNSSLSSEGNDKAYPESIFREDSCVHSAVTGNGSPVKQWKSTLIVPNFDKSEFCSKLPIKDSTLMA
ncbi:DNA-directed RNA polymerase I subunit rpa43 [Spatholobus suberectus]|nr:DNA-directed RNA polymerase I subunit rpa43 [Spatholobus suberectus]